MLQASTASQLCVCECVSARRAAACEVTGSALPAYVLYSAVTTHPPSFLCRCCFSSSCLVVRLFPIFDQVAALCEEWGVPVAAETAAEAKKSAASHDICWMGYNHSGNYEDEDDESSLIDPDEPDPNNGHVSDAPVPGAAPGGGSDGDMQQDVSDRLRGVRLGKGTGSKGTGSSRGSGVPQLGAAARRRKSNK